MAGRIKSVWAENGIPPLKYCSIERAAKLLRCEKSDIIHWMPDIQLMLEFQKSLVNASVWVKINPEGYRKSIDPGLAYIKSISYCTEFSLDAIRPVIEDEQEDIEDGETLLKFPAYFSGMASVFDGLYVDDSRRVVVIPAELYCTVPVGDNIVSDSFHAIDRNEIATINHIVFSAMDTANNSYMEEVIADEHLYISGSNIERIHMAGRRGEPIRSAPADININKKIGSKTTNSQAAFIKSLLHVMYSDKKAIDNPRSFFDDPNSEIAKDFAAKELKLPAGKTMEMWLKGVDIPLK